MASGRIYCLSTVDLDRVFHVDHLPGHDEKLFADSYSESAGGQGLYVARALASLRAPVTFVSAVGNDPAGVAMVDELSRIAGLVVDVTTVAGVRSGSCVILVDSTGEKAIILAPLAEAVIADLGRRVVVANDDIVTANFYHPAAIQDLFGRTRHAGGLSILDLETPGIDRWGWPAAIETVESAAIVCSNRIAAEHWARAFDIAGTPIDQARSFARFLAGDGRRACVTLGDQGVIVADGEGLSEIPAIKLQPRNTTGAGDSFLAGIAFGLRGGMSFVEAARFGVTVAADFLVHGAIDPDRLDPDRRGTEGF